MTEIKDLTDAELVERVAREFHETYERLAADYGYLTREDTKEFDPNSPNGQLMMAVIRILFDRAVLEATLKARSREADHDRG